MSANLMKEKEVEAIIVEETLFKKGNIEPSRKLFNFNFLELILITNTVVLVSLLIFNVYSKWEQLKVIFQL